MDISASHLSVKCKTLIEKVLRYIRIIEKKSFRPIKKVKSQRELCRCYQRKRRKIKLKSYLLRKIKRCQRLLKARNNLKIQSHFELSRGTIKETISRVMVNMQLLWSDSSYSFYKIGMCKDTRVKMIMLYLYVFIKRLPSNDIHENSLQLR